MKWTAITKPEIEAKIQADYTCMNLELKRFWDLVSIVPEKWQQSPYGNEGGGFWVVGLLGKIVIWYNDIEDGFNYSSYKKYGVIDNYECNQNSLDITINKILSSI